ncbi:MAG: peptidylprolyl isomerase [Oscillatoria sp. SIO1A7]|nr:peptidylprolyl isomerase [Oscillatoria sp. SIO1A7]
MLLWSESIANVFKRLLETAIMALLLFSLSLGLSGAWWNGSSTPKRESSMPPGNAITDPKSLLRYALPVKNQEIRRIQNSLEDISEQVRGRRWGPMQADLRRASLLLTTRESDLLESIPEAQIPQGQDLIATIQAEIDSLKEAVEAENRARILQEQKQVLEKVGDLEELMVQDFPFEVPSEYDNLPQLKGRATVEVVTSKGPVTILVDGYSAPVTAGNFVDLVQRGFYDGLPFVRSEDKYVLQAGDPPGPEVGFIDPDTGEYRNIPLEILVRGEEEPIYGITLEDLGLYREQPILPFSAYGTVALARPEEDPDGGSSQFFFFLFKAELTPAGLNLLDGRYTVFGYAIEGQEVLGQIKKGDKIESAKVIEGAENLVLPQV